MRPYLIAHTLLSLSSHVIANPIALDRRQNVYPQGPSDAVVLDLPTANPVPPPSATGSVYGTEALLGYDGNPVQGSAIVDDYQLVPGQLENPTEGLELDFELVEKPEPIRGTTGRSGATDPGPGMSFYSPAGIDLTSERHKSLRPFQQRCLCLSGH